MLDLCPSAKARPLEGPGCDEEALGAVALAFHASNIFKCVERRLFTTTGRPATSSKSLGRAPRGRRISSFSCRKAGCGLGAGDGHAVELPHQATESKQDLELNRVPHSIMRPRFLGSGSWRLQSPRFKIPSQGAKAPSKHPRDSALKIVGP